MPPDLASIGGVVQTAVDKHGQKLVADELGVTSAAVYNWRMGISRPDRGKLPELARLAQCPLAAVERAWAVFSAGDSQAEKALSRLEARMESLLRDIQELRRRLDAGDDLADQEPHGHA